MDVEDDNGVVEMQDVEDAQEPSDSGEPNVIPIDSDVEPVAIQQEPDPNLGSYTWDVLHYMDRGKDKMYSEDFEAGGVKWRILLFPKGNNSAECISVYLEAVDDDTLGCGWGRVATFTLSILNPLTGKDIVKDASHHFYPASQDWGFLQFAPLHEVNKCVVDGTLTIKATVKVERVDRPYDSKKETGYVGLKNQGATCYLNSLLQTLYNINAFRQAVYHMPTSPPNEGDPAQKNIPLALQGLFHKLQFSPGAVSTTDLTASFGWDTYDAFMQHDVQELNRVLCEKLEEKMKGTTVDGVINKLLEGHTHNFIECVNVDYKSTRRESFMDLQLDVKGCKDLYDSFDKYTETELLEGPNQYKADGHGLQDARKGVLLHTLPPILQLQLKRFEYDFQRDAMVKINDRYEFFEELDLDIDDRKYLTSDSDPDVCNKYRLHSVLVHSGGVHGGHYYAYVCPNGKRWLKFDDEKVTVETKEAALDEQFGGEDDHAAAGDGAMTGTLALPKHTKFSNAYMLVYVRESDWDKVMCEVTERDIAEHVRERLKAEQDELVREKREKAEAHLHTSITIFRDEDIAVQIGSSQWFDLINFTALPQSHTFRWKKELPFATFMATVEKLLGVPAERQRYWRMHGRQNLSVRVDNFLTQADVQKPLAALMADPQWGRDQFGLRLFLEIASTGPLPPITPNDYILFFKFYDPAAQKLQYLGHSLANRITLVGDLLPLVRAHLAALSGDRQAAAEVELELYEEVKFEPTMVELLDLRKSLLQSQLENGDIICVQVPVEALHSGPYRYPTVKDYLNYINTRVSVIFKRYGEPKEEGNALELNKTNSYEDVVRTLAGALGLDDPTRLRLWTHNPFTSQPAGQPVKFGAPRSLGDLLTVSNRIVDVLHYEVLDMPLPQVERLKQLKVAFQPEVGEDQTVYTVAIDRDCDVAGLLDALRKQLGNNAPVKPLRLLQIANSRIAKVYDPEDLVEQLRDTSYYEYRADVIADEEAALAAGGRLVHVYHYTYDAHAHVQPFGDPFLLAIGETETLAEVKSRIAAKLDVAAEEVEKWKFAVIGPYGPPGYLQDADELAPRFPAKPHLSAVGQELLEYLGMEHSAPARTRRTANRPLTIERPVRFYGS